jgi:ABC-type transport system substrate-binding protein
VLTNVAPLVDNIQAAKKCKLQMWGAAWIADYPDGDNFVQLLYGPNTGQSNNGCYESPAFDAFYRKSLAIPDSPERNRLFLEMSRQMEVDGAWSLHVARMRNIRSGNGCAATRSTRSSRRPIRISISSRSGET